jgi:hypothetical protein
MDLFQAADIITKLILSSIMGIVCALFSYFLDFCFWPGSIFKKWLPWLSKTLIKKYRKAEFELISKLPTQSQEQAFIDAAGEIFIFKPLGGCAVCMNIYIAFISYIFIWLFLGLEWPYFFAYAFTSSAFLRKLVKAIY